MCHMWIHSFRSFFINKMLLLGGLTFRKVEVSHVFDSLWAGVTVVVTSITVLAKPMCVFHAKVKPLQYKKQGKCS